MATWLFANDNTTALGGMASTLLLSDGSIGDTTGPTEASDSDGPAGVACGASLSAIAHQQAVWDGGSVQTITAISSTVRARTTVEDLGAACIDPAPTSSITRSAVYAYSTDGSSWTTLQTESPGNGFETLTWSGSVSARYIRCTVSNSYQTTNATNGIAAFAQNTDLRVTASATVNDCGLPMGAQDLPRGTRRAFTTSGTTAPTIDEWEIYRCVNSVLTLIDSSDIGDSGFEGWMVERSTTPGYDYDIYAPPTADIANDYECRISDSGNYSINFNVTTPTDEDTTMAERPRVFEKWQFGKEGTAGTAVVPNKKSQLLGMSPPTPMEPGQVVMQPGDRAAIEVISQKRHTEASITGPMGYPDLVYVHASLLHTPFTTIPGGATLTRDYKFMPRADADDSYATYTNETGNSDFPARADYGNITSATLNFGKTENTVDATMVMQAINETLNAFANANPDYIPLIPIAAKDNSYFLGTPGATFGTLTQLCDTQNFTFTHGTRRTPHFTQCSDEESYTVMLPVADSEMLGTYQLSHKSISRNMLTNLRNRDVLWFRFFNQGPVIEGSLRYEMEMIMPVKLMNPSNTDSDGATARSWELKPILDRTFNPFSMGTPGGYVAIRIRAKSTDVSMVNASAI